MLSTTQPTVPATVLDILYKTFGILGPFLGTLAFFWKIRDSFVRFLHIDLVVERAPNGITLLKTTVKNKGVFRQKIKYAVLLINPELEDPVDAFYRLTKLARSGPEKHTNDIVDKQIPEPIYDSKGSAIIPLPFYFRENIRIADEKISYTVSLPRNECSASMAARFYVIGPSRICRKLQSPRLHRSTQTAFTFPGANGE